MIFRLATLALFACLPFKTFAVEPFKAFTVNVSAIPFSDFEPANPTKLQFGRLEFRGGAILESDNRSFGGLSGLRVLDNGTSLLAVSDSGYWLSAKIKRDNFGAIWKIEDAKMSQLWSGAGPRKNPQKYYVDAEGLTFSGDRVLVAFEAINTLSSYERNIETLSMEPTLLDLPKSVDSLSVNKGLEALATAPNTTPFPGAIIALSERGERRSADFYGWLLNDDGSSYEDIDFRIKRRDNFDLTEVDFLPNGDVLILERRFTLATGVAMRMRRIPSTNVKKNALLDGEVMIEAALAHRIDNMEGLSVYKNEKGETILAMISDDNHSLLQKTIYLEFALIDDTQD